MKIDYAYAFVRNIETLVTAMAAIKRPQADLGSQPNMPMSYLLVSKLIPQAGFNREWS